MAKAIAVVSTACLIALVVYVFWHGPRRDLDSVAVVKQVQRLNELVTVRYGIEKVVGLKEDKWPVGSESILLLVEGRVLAGVDLSQLKAGDVRFIGRDDVHVRLPPAHIEDAYLDEKYTKVWDRSITWWTPWVTADIDLEHKARMRALEEIKASALEMNILGDARRNAEMDIRSLLEAFGMKNVEFSYD
jgi:hypothetical protein